MPAPGSGTTTRGDPHARAAEPTDPDGDDRRRGVRGPGAAFTFAARRPWLTAAVALIVLAVPLVTALAALRHPRWYPVLDLAQTELRVRDVGSGHPPLIGLLGRFGTTEHPGSHPGPISFYALWPLWALLGKTSFALRVASVAVHLAAMATTVVVARRRGGTGLALGVGALLAVTTSALGVAVFVEPWNPYLPSVWWLTLLLAVWSVVCDDWPMLAVAVVAGSFCAQTHASYAGVVGGLALFTAVTVGLKAYRARGDRETSRRIALWTAVAVVGAVVLWIPPLIDQFTSSPGNLSIVASDFLHPPGDPIGIPSGLRQVLLRLDPWTLATGQHAFATGGGSIVPGVGLLTVWAASALLVRRRGERRLNRLNLVLLVSLGLATYSASRIYGITWYYLLLPGWGLAAAMLFSIGWAAEVARRTWRAEGGTGPAWATARAAWVAPVVAVFVLLGFAGAVTARATGATAPNPQANAALGSVVGPTVDALRTRMEADPADHRRFLVTWADTATLGDQGWGLLNELERAGIPAGVGYNSLWRAGARPHRVVPRRDQRAVVHIAVGTPAIAAARAREETTEIAFADPRDAAQRAEFRRLRTDAARRLRAAGQVRSLRLLDSSLFLLALDPEAPARVRSDVRGMLRLGVPVAVFVAPAGTRL